MRRLAILNQKGGVGKTTTAVNLSAALTRQLKRVCLFDLDPQAHATTHLGMEPIEERPSIYDVLVNNQPLSGVRRELSPDFALVGADLNLAAAEVELAGIVGRELILGEAIQQDAQSFDYMVMDCGPSLGILTLNALAAANEVLIPLQPHFLALHGLGKLLETTAIVSRRINPQLKVAGIILCLVDSSTRLAQEVIRDLEAFLGQSRNKNVPWKNAKIFSTRIRRNIKLAECPSHGKSIFEYAPTSHGALDYIALAEEIIGTPAVPRVPLQETVKTASEITQVF